MNLDKQLNFSDRRVHEAALYALDCFTSAQYSNGAWPQRYQDFNHQSKSVVVNATIPVAWSREYPGAKYANFYTLNDNTISDMILLMLDAWEIYADRRYLESAKRGGDFCCWLNCRSRNRVGPNNIMSRCILLGRESLNHLQLPEENLKAS